MYSPSSTGSTEGGMYSTSSTEGSMYTPVLAVPRVVVPVVPRVVCIL